MTKLLRLLLAFVFVSLVATAPLTTQADVRHTSNCAAIVRHDDMATCYFKAHDWKNVIRAYDTTPPHSLSYPNDRANDTEDVVSWYQKAIAYKHLGEVSKEQTADSILGLMLDPYHKSLISKWLAAQMLAEYKSSGAQAQDAQENVVVR